MPKVKVISEKRYIFDIVATGGGVFPFDMLRYDTCYPKSEIDASRMGLDRQREIRLTMVSPTDEGPTVARWKSRLWNVQMDEI